MKTTRHTLSALFSRALAFAFAYHTRRRERLDTTPMLPIILVLGYSADGTAQYRES